MPMLRFPPPFKAIERMPQVFCMADCRSVIMVTRSVCATMYSTSDRLLVKTQLLGQGTPSIMNNASMWRR